MRNAQKLSGYYKMPMAAVVRIVITVVMVAICIAFAATMVGVVMVLVVVILIGFLSTRLGSRSSFDMNVGNMVSRVAVPHGGAKAGDRSPVEQEQIRGIEAPEVSLPAKVLLPGSSHLRISNDFEADDATDLLESAITKDSNTTFAATVTKTASG